MSGDTDKGLTDRDLDLLIDREDKKQADGDGAQDDGGGGGGGGGGERQDSEQRLLETGVAQSAADFQPELPVLLTRQLQGETFVPQRVGDIGQAWAAVSGKREKKSRLMKVGGDAVLKIND